MNELTNNNKLNVLNDEYVLETIKTVEECQRALDIEYSRKEYFENKGIVLVGKNKEFEITSVQLVDIINNFRKEEGNETEKEHKDFMKSIRKELKDLENAGIEDGGNFSLISYIDNMNREKPCYNMNKAGAMQMLNKESAVVRYKTQLYIEQLEKRNEELNTPSCMIQDIRIRLKVYERELDQQEYRQCLERINTLEQLKVNLTMTPLVEKYNIFMDAEGLTSIERFSQNLSIKGLGRNNMYKYFREKGYLKRDNKPYQYYIDNGWFKLRPSGYHMERGEIVQDYKTFLTTKGVNKIIDVLIKEGYINN